MKLILLSSIALALFLSPPNTTIYQFTMDSLEGEAVSLSKYEGKVMVVVNTASKCGHTPQYADLQKFHEEYAAKGVAILGFPANNFLKQEPGENDEIREFCTKNYGVTFDMFSKISVKGSDIHPLYQFLTEKEKNGNVEDAVSWNFQKFIINKKGEVVASISPKTSIYDPAVVTLINDLLKE